MFQDEPNKKLDWMYKDPGKNIDREEYVLGRSIDKSLEQLNEEEKQKQNLNVSKSKVEHECIPPSIRDFNKIVQAEQVDLSTKLQEDPLVAIKKREEETRRQFLQNPVQLKKLQKALKAQQIRKEKKKKKSKDLDKNLDTILMHKFHALKQYLSEKDMQEIMGITDDTKLKKDKKINKDAAYDYNRQNNASDNSKHKSDRTKFSDHSQRRRYESDNFEKIKKVERQETKKTGKSSESETSSNSDDWKSDDSDLRNKRTNFGLTRSDGSKITLKGAHDRGQEQKHRMKKPEVIAESSGTYRSKKLTEEEKDKIRQEMVVNASWRDKERATNLRHYRREHEKESKHQEDFDKLFIHKQLVKSGNSSDVGSRIRSKMNSIQRSNKDY